MTVAATAEDAEVIQVGTVESATHEPQHAQSTVALDAEQREDTADDTQTNRKQQHKYNELKEAIVEEQDEDEETEHGEAAAKQQVPVNIQVVHSCEVGGTKYSVNFAYQPLLLPVSPPCLLPFTLPSIQAWCFGSFIAFSALMLLIRCREESVSIAMRCCHSFGLD